MADLNQIDIVVAERGVGEAQERVVQLADAADRAEGSVGKLRAQMDSFRSGGLASAVRELQNAAQGSQTLRQETEAGVKAQAASTSASRASAEARQYESTKIAGLIGTKAELRELERAMAAEERAASAAAKQYLAEEAGQRQMLVGAILAESKANDQLTAARVKQNIETAQATQRETELARASELAALRNDIVSRSASGAKTDKEDQNNRAAAAQAAQAQAEASAVLAEKSEMEAAGLQQVAAATIEARSATQERLAIEREASSMDSTSAEMQDRLAAAIARENEAKDVLIASTSQLNEIRAYEQVQMAQQTEQYAALSTVRFADVTAEELQIASTNGLGAALERNFVAMGLMTAATEADTVANTANQLSNIRSTALIGLFEGRLLGVTRAAGQVLGSILRLVPAVASFVGMAVGVAAIGFVFYQVFEHVQKTRQEIQQMAQVLQRDYTAAIDAAETSAISLEARADKLQLQLDKLNHKPEQNSLVIQFDEALESGLRLGDELDKLIAKSNELLAKNTATKWQQFLGAGDASRITGSVQGFNREIQGIRDEYQQLFKDIDARTDLDPARKLLDINANRDRELGAISDKYAAGTKFLQGVIKTNNDNIEKLTSAATKFGADQHVQGNNNVSDLQAEVRQAQLALQLMEADQKQIGAQYREDNMQSQVNVAREAAAAMKDDAKAAREEWKNAKQAYEDYAHTIAERTGENPTPTQSRDFFQQMQPRLSQANQPNVRNEIGKYQEQINLQQRWVKDQIGAEQERADAMNKYGKDLRETTDLEKFENEARAKGITLTQAQIDQYSRANATVVNGATYQRALNEVYRDGEKTLEQYNAMMAAYSRVIREHPELTQAATIAQNKLRESHANAIDPLRQYNLAIADSYKLLEFYGQQADIEANLQQRRNQLIASGDYARDSAGLNAEIEREREQQTALANQIELHKDLDTLYKGEADLVRKLGIEQIALNTAYTTGNMSAQAYKSNSVQNLAEQINAQNSLGKGTKGDFFTTSLAASVKGFKDVSTSIKSIMGDLWTNLRQGFASTVSNWIVNGGSAKEMFAQLARQILTGVIDSLIQLGIQLLIVDGLFKALHLKMPKTQDAADVAATTAAAVAGITAVTAAQLVSISLMEGPAWSLAEAVSLFSFGANAAGATAGIATVTALGSAAQHFQYGGLVDGPRGVDAVPAWLTRGEYVIDKPTVDAYGADHFEAMQRGVSSVGANSPNSNVPAKSAGSRGLIVNVIHDGSTAVRVEKGTSPDEVRLIAKQAVFDHADEAVGQAVPNANSKTRKAFAQHTSVRAQR